MANGGWYGTAEEWERAEAPIKLLDPAFREFAERHDLTIVYNEKDWPSRAVSWGDDIRCLIQIWLVELKTSRINVWLCASQDRGNRRFWRRTYLFQDVEAAEVVPRLADALEEGRVRLALWQSEPDKMEFAVQTHKLGSL